MKSLALQVYALFLALFFSHMHLKAENPTTINMVPEEKPSHDHSEERLRIGIIGLVHTHVHWILGRDHQNDIEIVGIVEPNRDLAQRYSMQHGFSMDLVFNTIEEMIESSKPEAVTVFNTIYDHLSVVEYCAPRGIHIMVEKPLAVNLEHAEKMEKLAKEHKIHLLTNYETSWYGSTADAYSFIHTEQSIGEIRKMVFHTGHQGPIEIGVNKEFLEWLIDPYWNGGGALTDFGCYGVNIANYFMKGEKPLSVYCETKQIKPEKYPKVDDEALIILDFEKAQIIIQASWNWPFNRKDMEVYGTNGAVFCENSTDMRLLINEKEGFNHYKASKLRKGEHDPFAYLHSLIRGNVKMNEFDLHSLENNMMVMQILEAAKLSAQSGLKIDFKTFLEKRK